MSDSISGDLQAKATEVSDSTILERTMSKVSEVTVGFWIIKIAATTLGEVGGNAVTLTMKLGYLLGTIIFGVPLIGAVLAQIRAKKFILPCIGPRSL